MRKQLFFIISLIILGLFFPSFSFSQENKAEQDSLFSLANLAYDHINTNPEVALTLLDNLYSLAKEKKSEYYQGYSLNLQGAVYAMSLNSELATRQLNKAEDICKNEKNLLNVYINQIMVNCFLNNFHIAKDYIEKAKKISVKLENRKMGLIRSNEAMVFIYSKDFTSANIALKDQEKYIFTRSDSCRLYNDWSYFYLMTGKPKLAKRNALKALNLQDSLNHDLNFLMANAHVHLGEANRLLKDFQEARKHLIKGLELAKQYQIGIAEKEALEGLKSLHVEKGDIEGYQYYDKVYKNFLLKIKANLNSHYGYQLDSNNEELVKMRNIIEGLKLGLQKTDIYLYSLGGFLLLLFLVTLLLAWKNGRYKNQIAELEENSRGLKDKIKNIELELEFADHQHEIELSNMEKMKYKNLVKRAGITFDCVEKMDRSNAEDQNNN
ncbi:hypothetical protein [Xanthovirga aplysinae]|uniref:hypothetical protein n=1 Tax=Xanthovirga aplysinae TaxID=2529853 RepID=UPI0012BD7E67|nr:hypothetical protein [Xanthovirga aplysinae]MTI31428.1 hypothetical protein [Xanthovirga aplysinae]